MTFFGLSGLQVLGLVMVCLAGLGVLYLLRRPPRKLTVPSVLLWERVLEQRRRRAPDYLRRLISWLFASGIALFLVVALGDPEFAWLAPGRRQLQIVLHNGPSMLATGAGGVSRWEAAQNQVERLLKAESPASRVLLQNTGEHSRAGGAVTPDEAIRQLQDMEVGLSGEFRFPDPVSGFDSLLFFTDGGADLEAPPESRRISVYSAIDNIRLEALDIRLQPEREAILKIVNLGRRPREVRVSLRDSAGQNRQETIPIAAHQEATLTTSLEEFIAGPIVAELVGLRDGFSLDDSRFEWLPPARRKVLLAGDRNPTLEALLSLYSELDVEFVGKPDEIEGGTAEAVILSNWAPEKPPGLLALVMGVPEVSWLPRPTSQFSGTEGLYWERNHRLTRGVDLIDLRVTRARSVEAGSAIVLAGTQLGYLLLVHESAPVWAQMTFRLEESNLGRQPALPILVDNFLEWVSERGLMWADLGEIELEAGSRLWDPDGLELEMRSAFGRERARLIRPGIYSAITPSGRIQIIANAEPVRLNLESPGQEPSGEPVETSPGLAWWKVLLLLAGVASLGEWALFHRRLTV